MAKRQQRTGTPRTTGLGYDQSLLRLRLRRTYGESVPTSGASKLTCGESVCASPSKVTQCKCVRACEAMINTLLHVCAVPLDLSEEGQGSGHLCPTCHRWQANTPIMVLPPPAGAGELRCCAAFMYPCNGH